MITDTAWLQAEFLETVHTARRSSRKQRRVVGSLGRSRGDRLRAQRPLATPGDDWHSLAVASHGEYGTPEGLQFGFPVRSDGSSTTIVEGIEHDEFAQGRITITTQELVDEREDVRALGLLGG